MWFYRNGENYKQATISDITNPLCLYNKVKYSGGVNVFAGTHLKLSVRPRQLHCLRYESGSRCVGCVGRGGCNTAEGTYRSMGGGSSSELLTQ